MKYMQQERHMLQVLKAEDACLEILENLPNDGHEAIVLCSLSQGKHVASDNAAENHYASSSESLNGTASNEHVDRQTKASKEAAGEENSDCQY